jgi:hypothetical protein
MVQVLLLLQACCFFTWNAWAGSVIVFGIDETGSYEYRHKAIVAAQTVISRLQPGDIFFLRRITDSSYQDKASVLTLELPALSEPPRNRYDSRARAAWRRKSDVIEQFKAKTIDYLATLASQKCSKTDIWGFFAASAERLQLCEQAENKAIFIASDLRDNCALTADFDLLGAEVIVIGYAAGEKATETLTFRKQWTEAILSKGASAVLFVPVDMIEVALRPE